MRYSDASSFLSGNPFGDLAQELIEFLSALDDALRGVIEDTGNQGALEHGVVAVQRGQRFAVSCLDAAVPLLEDESGFLSCRTHQRSSLPLVGYCGRETIAVMAPILTVESYHFGSRRSIRFDNSLPAVVRSDPSRSTIVNR